MSDVVMTMVMHVKQAWRQHQLQCWGVQEQICGCNQLTSCM
jgi:hypothetical protein